jgi:DNA-binding CsgD family transcriptional regulator
VGGRASPPEGKPKGASALTPREAEVLRWLREGKTNEEISIILGCARRTVEGHGLRLYRKLGISNRAGVHLLKLDDQNGRKG